MSFLHIQSARLDEVGVSVRPSVEGGAKVWVRFGEAGSAPARLSMSIAEAENLRDQLSAAIAEAVAS